MSVPIPSAKSKPGFYGGTDAKVRIKHLINITKVLFNTILTVRNSTFHSKMPLLTNHQEFTIVESVVCTHHVWHVLGLVIIMGKALPLCGIGFVKKTSNLSGAILACLRIKCPPVGKTAKMSNFCNSLYANGLQEIGFHSPQKYFQSASLHLVICVTLPCNLRQITSLFASLHALIDVVSHPHSLSLTAS